MGRVAGIWIMMTQGLRRGVLHKKRGPAKPVGFRRAIFVKRS